MTILNRFQCARCKGMPNYAPLTLPGPCIGSLVVDQPACVACHKAHYDYMERFWGGASLLVGQKCPKCEACLTRQNSKPAYRRAINGDTVKLSVICDCCHAEYAKCCASAAAKK